MTDKHDVSAQESRQQRIRSVVDECIGLWARGADCKESAVVAQHDELMPELGEQLRKARLVAHAVDMADDPSAADVSAARCLSKNTDSVAFMPEDPAQQALRIRCPHCRNPVELVDDDPLDQLHCDSCGSQFNLSRPPAEEAASAPRWLAHFQLESLLGLGGFGAVWKAIDTELRREVAIKIPRRGELSRRDEEQFFREARLAAQLNHPHIAAVHEIGRDRDTLYIVSDLVHGVTLSDWMRQRKVGFTAIAELCAQIAQALHYAHEKGIVHRDLKPSNIMIDAEGQPRIMDFGLAKRQAGEITMTLEGQVLGTPAYMSPEQARGEARQVDARADVYSLGVILFELLTGELPFRGSVRMLIHQIQHEEAPSPRGFGTTIPRDLETICLKCLAKQPAQRYATARRLADELRRFARGEPIRARPISRLQRLWRWSRREPMAAFAASLVLLIAVTAPSIATYERIQRLHIQRLNTEQEAMISQLQQQKFALAEERKRLTAIWRRAEVSQAAPDAFLRMARGFYRDYPVDELVGDDRSPSAKAQIYLGLAYLSQTQGTWRQTMELFTRARESLRQVATAEAASASRIALMECNLILSQQHRQLQNLDDALRSALEAVEIGVELTAEAPLDVALHGQLVEAYKQLAALHYERDDNVSAIEAIRRINEITERIKEEFPRDPAGLYFTACQLAKQQPWLLDANGWRLEPGVRLEPADWK